jgi:hypothetical protein
MLVISWPDCLGLITLFQLVLWLSSSQKKKLALLLSSLPYVWNPSLPRLPLPFKIKRTPLLPVKMTDCPFLQSGRNQVIGPSTRTDNAARARHLSGGCAATLGSNVLSTASGTGWEMPMVPIVSKQHEASDDNCDVSTQNTCSSEPPKSAL